MKPLKNPSCITFNQLHRPCVIKLQTPDVWRLQTELGLKTEKPLFLTPSQKGVVSLM